MTGQYINRDISSYILEANRYFSVITITGPRQSGKSTLLRHLFPDIEYYSLEDPDVRMTALEDPRGFLNGCSDRVILDEIQNTPSLLSYIQGIVDNNSNRRFYLTGSAQLNLISQVTQSLAGRTAIFELLPLALDEISEPSSEMMLDSIMYNGFYPAIWSGKNIAKLLYPNYLKTYIERDVRQLLAIKNLDVFQRFIRLCAARIGSIFNASELSNELGVAVSTINAWLSVLQTSYIVYMLPPFFTNTRKRLTKSPKIYFTDCGLAAYLLGIDSVEVLARDKMRGHLFENMVVMQALKHRFNQGQNGGLYFYRDSNGNEVDLLVQNGSMFDCYEIKSSETFSPGFVKGLNSFASAFPDLCSNRTVVYNGSSLPDYKDVAISNFRDLSFITPPKSPTKI